jgi:hypothetical protein
MFEERSIKVKDDDLLQQETYIPIYTPFLGKTSHYSDLILNYSVKITEAVKYPDSYNGFIGLKENMEKLPIFVKYCPLSDPIKIMIGKTEYSDFSLPTVGVDEHIFADKNNSAYVDSFFSYITSKMLHNHNFINGLDCYGSCLALKKNFRVDIVDDLEYLFDSEYFMEHKDDFKISDNLYEQFQPSQSCKYKKKLNIDFQDDVFDLEIDEINSETEIATQELTSDTLNMFNKEALIYNHEIHELEKKSRSNHTGSMSGTCSSRSSITTDEEIDEYEVGSDDEEFIDSNNPSRRSSMYSYEDDDEDEEPVYAYLDVMPTNMVFLEACSKTLDEYMVNNELDESEWSAILMQIVMALITFQDKVLFIHNDLHTSNVMFIPTEKEYLYYRYNESYYKVPTYGKIWKIIDFGRAIYKYKGTVIFSDSFGQKGDASTQYNCEPYLNPNKQIVPPNFSFDLCRLACSLYDYFEDDEDDRLIEIKTLIEEWLKDDKGRNILYKKNGDERYEDFKLYKMISRTVHGAIPKNQLSQKIFAQYLVSRKNIKKKMHMVMNIDEIPDLTM